MKLRNSILKEEAKISSLRLVVLVTYNCNFDCVYCCVPKEVRQKRDMPQEYLLKSVDFLLTSSKENLQLHFFGAEPLLLSYEVYSNVLSYCHVRSSELKKRLKPIVTTNGAVLNKQWIGLFKKYGVRLEISLDGTPWAHNMNRPRCGHRNSYDMVVRNLPLIFDSDINVQVSMVITPRTAKRLYNNFLHLVHLGFQKIFMMVANGVFWDKKNLEALQSELIKLELEYPRIAKENSLVLLNLKDWVKPMRMNTELAVDRDGSIYSACVGYLVKDPEVKQRCTLANIMSVQGSIDNYEPLRLSNAVAMDIVFSESKTYHTLPSCIQSGNIMASFVKRLNKKLNNCA